MDIVVQSVVLRPYVFAFVAAFLLMAVRDLGARRTLLFGAWVFGVAWTAEFASTRVGSHSQAGSSSAGRVWAGSSPPLAQGDARIRRVGGVGLYYGVLAFNLTITWWIGEVALFLVGVALHVAVFAVLLAARRVIAVHTVPARCRDRSPATGGSPLRVGSRLSEGGARG
jgi:hypothetical protein